MKSTIFTAVKIALAAIFIVSAFGFISNINPVAEAACNTACPTPIPDLLGTCYPDKETVNINENVNWTAVASGGTGQYSYSWRDDEGHIGNGKNVSTSYFLTGRKDVIVSITSGSYTIQRLCHVNVVNNNPNPIPLTVSCVANPSNVNVNDNVTYTASVSGGNGTYSYSWSGTDGLSGNNQSVSKSYSSSGSKTGTVVVTSGNQSRTATCSAFVNQAANLNVSCAATPSQANINDTVVYTASVSGGDGNYNYSWSGTDGLSGNSQTVTRQYSFTGTKTGTVVVTSGGQSRTATCSTFINQQNNNNQIYATCYASPSSANVNDNVSWYSTASGGNGNYTYSWSGTDGLYGNSQSVYKSYGYSGTKSGTVTVYSNGQSTTAYCSMYVNGNNNNQNLTAYCYGTPSNAAINTNVTWYGSASGGNGSYYYSWSGADNLYGYNQTMSKSYSFGGSKNAVLTVTSNNQTAQANCSINVQNNGGTVLTQYPNGTPASGVYLSQVPYTGGSLNLKVALFVLGLFIFSAFGAYMIILKKNAGLATPYGRLSQKDLIAKFKEENLSRKG